MNLMKISKKLVFSITLILTLFMFSGIAFATHIGTSIKWSVAYHGNVVYHSEFSSSDATNRINEAANDWNSWVYGIQWQNYTTNSHYHKLGYVPYGNNAATWVTHDLYFPNQIDDVYTLYNQDYSWYYGTGSPSATQWDLLSVAKHEFGHWYHLEHCADDNHTNYVMWRGIGAGQVKRTLASHDYAEAQAMYMN